MNSVINKRIKGLLIIIFISIVTFVFNITDVNAEIVADSDCGDVGKQCFANLILKANSTTLTITRPGRGLCNQMFFNNNGTITKTGNSDMRVLSIDVYNNVTNQLIYHYDVTGDNAVLSFGESFSVPLSTLRITEGMDVRITVNAVSVATNIVCGGHTTGRQVAMGGTGSTSIPWSSSPIPQPVNIQSSVDVSIQCRPGGNEADCHGNYSPPSGSGSGSVTPEEIDPKDFNITVKCPYNKLAIPDKDDPNYYINKNDADYFLNHNEYVKRKSFTVTGQYTYITDPGAGGVVHDTPTCKLHCDETVTVEYGPPVASKAGLCFEYKVKVKSEVKCEIDKEVERPREPQYCAPHPYCTGGYLSIENGGPSQEFDNCIISCDGGKYTDKCSNKCYKKVYGSSISNKNNNKISYNDKLVNNNSNVIKVANATLSGDYWYTDATNLIHYTGGRAPGQPEIGTNGYVTTIDGISTSYTCNANCWWERTCRLDGAKVPYLNGYSAYSGTSQMELDADANMAEYNRLKKRCEAYASCSTTTAEFTISVDYSTKGSTQVKRINFPYTSNNDGKDTITYQNADSTTCTKDNGNSTLLDSDYCYKCGKATSQKKYMTEWSFPGAWINNKSGELTFDKSKVNTRTWQTMEDKFCLPLNVKNVNTKWYNYYFAKMHGSDGNISYNDSQYTNSITCADGTKLNDISCDYRNTKFTDEDAKHINYNINAIVKNFGFYNWNINIKCFYAVNDEFPGYEGKTCKTTCDNDSSSDKNKKYRIRTVDLGNLFPDSQGNKLTTTDTTGRTPGFNWTKYSNQTIKDTSYKSLASNYTKWVQAKGYSVYSDDYLDYEVNLTKDLINKLKRRDKNYTAWEGDTSTDSVVNYQSPLFRNGGILSGNSHYPNGQALKCNNMKNYKSSECDDFTGEVR